jgi:pimeloyl-ACP methyl ester carboxylesterase
MGGMIGQTLAIEHPARVRSLVSIMSTTGSRRVGTPTLKAFGILLAKAPRGRDAYIERIVKTFKVVGSPAYPMDEAQFRDLAGRLYDRSHNPKGVLRQMHAISASGDRTAALRKLRLPATVIHGTRDPLVRPSGGRATARAIPGARLRIVEGMGHDLPRDLWPIFADEIADTASRAGWRAPAAQAA